MLTCFIEWVIGIITGFYGHIIEFSGPAGELER